MLLCKMSSSLLLQLLCILLNVKIVAVFLFDKYVALPGGKFQMGIDDFDGRNGEAPSYQSAVKPFKIDKYPVTNYQFQKFINSKSYITEAETKGWSYVFVGHQQQSQKNYSANVELKTPWMIPVEKAYWKNPFGPGSSVKNILSHPVVHVSKRDAATYCLWLKKRLPSEYEWEFAARGGLRDVEYPWGDNFETGRSNLWQGQFPEKDSALDGYAGTSPVDAFPAQNDYGIYDMIGNVWEWTNTQYHIRFNKLIGRDHYFVIRGGSYLDSRRGHINMRARVSARDGKSYNYTAGNVGFRCAAKTEPTNNFAAAKTSFIVHTEL